MSFVRINRRPVRTKKVSAPKKEWVSTVNDLSVHKATPEELSRRRDMHRSHNKAAAQWEMRERAQKGVQRKTQPLSPTGLDQARLRIIREVFSDQFQTHDVLARSDRAMAAVRDLFGDVPRKQTGFPNVTVAPDYESDSELPVQHRPDPPTQISALTQSVTDHQALNELEEPAGDHEEDDDDDDDSISLGSETCRPKRKVYKAPPPLWTTDQHLQQQNLPRTPRNVVDSGGQAALNATAAVQRLRSKQPQSETAQSSIVVTQVLNPDAAPSHSGGKSRTARTPKGCSSGASGMDSSGVSSQTANQSSLEMLQDLLGQVDIELAGLEPQQDWPEQQQQQQHGRGLTGFSMALVTTLGRITNHLRRREEKAQKELEERRRLEEVVRDQRELIDALTGECLALREESDVLQESLHNRIAELEQRLDMAVLAQTQGHLETRNAETETESKEQDLQSPEPTPTGSDIEDIHASEFPVVLLSPPRQRDSRMAPAERVRSLHFEDTASTGSIDESECSRTASSFISLPNSVLPRPAPIPHPLFHSELLEHSAVPSRQDAEVQFRPSPAGASAECRGQSADSAVRQTLPPTGQHPVQQFVAAHRPSVRQMEDRMQELNRQSAAARAKLLELIEQQRQINSHNASPRISPIPANTTGPSTVGGALTQDACVSVEDRGHPSHYSASLRRSAGAVSPQNAEGGERQSFNTQVDTQAGGGWFALSAHLHSSNSSLQ